MTKEEAILARLEQAIEERVFPGAVVGVVNRSGERQIVPVGRFTYEDGSRTVDKDTVYDVASITKAVPLGLLAIKFIEEGRLGLDDQVIKYIPEISIPGREQGLVRHLLTYTYMLEKNADPHFSYANSRAADIFTFLYTRPFAFPPGSRYQYSNTPANLLGVILERLSEKKLHDLAHEMILAPLKMARATFHPNDPAAIPPTEIVEWRGEVQGIVHDETAFILEREGFDPGCAGLFSDADSLLNAAEMMLGGGELRGMRLFKPESVNMMTTNALSGIGESCAIGWELNQPKFMGAYAHEHMIGKTGFTGTCMVIDPRRGKGFILLSNRTYPKRRSADPDNAVRRDIADIIFAP
jgi:serine-type D-Ala-D-Ala carboxypeptidase